MVAFRGGDTANSSELPQTQAGVPVHHVRHGGIGGRGEFLHREIPCIPVIGTKGRAAKPSFRRCHRRRVFNENFDDRAERAIFSVNTAISRGVHRDRPAMP